EYVYSRPDVITAGVSIFHPQLRDLLQPGYEKGKVMFVHGSAIECVDFDSMKGPTQFCSLDFDAVCLTTGSGLLAAGGEHSELDIRPLLPPPQGEASSSSSHFRNQRYTPRWHLRTPTGGSINNSICIQPEPKPKPSTIRGVVFDEEKGSKEAAPLEQKLGHREKRRKENLGNKSNSSAWKRDEPWGRPGEEATPDQEGEGSEQAIGIPGKEGEPTINKASRSNTIRLMISNNDRSLKAFRLRPPTRNRTPQNECVQSERIESGLPGLSRTQIIAFPTCINHSSFSPDGRHVVSVGDTPEVFLFSVHPITSELSKIATYTASSDASFSTTWSPDGMQFAVASQDGIVSVWDVRSSKKIAALQTTQFSDLYGAGAARVVKWSPRGDVLAFSEQQNYIHIVDTITFEIVQRIRLPTLAMNEPSSTSTEEAIPTNEEWLETTSPARFTSANRATASNEGSNLSRQWPSGRRYRDLGNLHSTRSGLDRALLGDWISARRSPLNVTDRGSGVWSIGPNVGGRLRRRDDSNVEISGLTWDPDGDHLYISTSELIARYTVIDLRRSFGQASVR
ncbi:WD40 repeat-like protein, partial [Meira miltonrushii]